MFSKTRDSDLLKLQPDLVELLFRLKLFGAQADTVSDIPIGFFDGIDARSLNCNGFEHDGKAASTVTQRCRLFELLGHSDPALAVSLPGASLTLPMLRNLASPQQYSRALSILQSDGPRWGAFALTEQHSGSDATHLALKAQPVMGGYKLSGEKCYIGNAGRAQYAIAFATIDPKKGQFGIRAFLLELPIAGLRIEDDHRMLGLRAVRVSRLTFENCFVPEENMLGHGTQNDLARSFAFAQMSFDVMRPCLSSLIVGAGFGVIDRMREETSLTPSLRSAIGNLIERFEGPLNSAQLLCRNAAALLDKNTQSSVSSSICKLYATEQTCQLIEQSLQLPGIASYELFETLSRLHRDFQSFRMMEGTSDVHRLMIARERNVQHAKREKALNTEIMRENSAQRMVA
jgi:acyl-CoA dehydrogenase